MTMTPNLIAEFLTPWALALLAYPIVVLSARCVAVIGPRMAASALSPVPHERRFTSRDVAAATALAATGWALASTIHHLVPGQQWWAHPLTTGWEISHAVSMIVMAVAGLLLYVTAALLTLVVWLALVAWLGESVDGGPGSRTRIQTMRRVVEAAWSKMLGRFNFGAEATSS